MREVDLTYRETSGDAALAAREVDETCDEFYRAMSGWTASDHNVDTITHLLKLAARYKRGLNRSLQYLSLADPSDFISLMIEQNLAYQESLAGDIDLLRQKLIPDIRLVRPVTTETAHSPTIYGG